MTGFLPRAVRKKLLWFAALLLTAMLASFWWADDGPSLREGGASSVLPSGQEVGRRPPPMPMPAPGREATSPGGDFSPPPGNITQAPSTAWPFASPGQVRSAGQALGWMHNAVEVVGAYWRAALAKLASVAPALPTAPNPATRSGSSDIVSPRHEFETPPGVGSPRGGK